MEAQPAGPGSTGTGELPEGHRLLGKLARDGGLPVYLAEDMARGERVTLTDLGPLDDPNALSRLARAMDAVTGLAHPCIRPVRAVGAGDGHAYLVSPHVEDPDLGQRLAEWGPLPVAAALNVLGQVADALDAAHGVGVPHGRVRPGVIRFAAGTERPYLTDFGANVARAPDANSDLAAVQHKAPEQVMGAPVDRRTDVYALGGLLFRCLTGLPPFPGHDPGAVLAASLHADPPRVRAYRPDLPGELDRVVATAMAKNPAHRYGTCQAVVDAAAAATGLAAPALPQPRGVRPRRRIPWRVALAGLVSVALVSGGVVATPHVSAAFWPTSEDLARVPAAVRGDCELTGSDARLPAAQRVLRCTEGTDNVIIGLFGDDAVADTAYRTLVASNAAVRSGTGDCANGTESEHRYPGVGDSQGRVMCDRVGSTARMVWVDRTDRAVAVAERVDGNAFELYRAWAGWVAMPAFPILQEQQLLDVLVEDGCRRAPAGPLDGLDGVVAAVECTPDGAGAGTVTYYRFADPEALRRAYDSEVARFGAPSGRYCGDAGASGPGEDTYSRAVISTGHPLGRLACGPGPELTWTDDALLIKGRATGVDPAAIREWWKQYSGPSWRATVDAVNKQAAPPFPTPEEDALLQLIPPASRFSCLRPPSDTRRGHVGDAAVVGVACATANGPASVYYYRFADATALNAEIGPADGPDCATVGPGSYGAARYTRQDGSSGTLSCGTNDAGLAIVKWSDDQASVIGYAFDPDPAVLIPWWQTNAGPN